MKLSVSIPDNLWETAQLVSNQDNRRNPSQLVQAALKSLIAQTFPEPDEGHN